MLPYDMLASFYDALTENVQYETRCAYISGFLSGNGVAADGRLLDLACGTGTLTQLLANCGYRVTGVDLSPEMLALAQQKCPDGHFFCCSMADYQSEQKFDACVCTLDSINHLTHLQEVKRCFHNVASNLKDNGLFVFDVNTQYKHRHILAEHTYVFDEEDFYLVWDNERVDADTVRVLIDIFVFNGKNYDRMSEDFLERAYDIKELKSALADFEVLGIYDELTQEQPKATSQRLYFVCRKNSVSF